MEHVSQPIGSLTKQLANSLEASASTPTSSPQASETTGLPSQALMAASSTGRQLGATGAAGPLLTALAGADASSTDKALIASLPPSVRSRLKSKVNHEFDLIGYEVGRSDTALAMEARDLALQIAEAACVPASASVALTEIGACFAVTAAREHDEQDIQVTLKAMMHGLAEFPADVIRDACRSYAKCHKWRPTLAELREFCWHRYRARHSLRETLRRAA